ncbi:hypothetical protein Q6A26_07985 [Xanthomonas euvesicatoria pv. eucalypti]|nr:hypothetical protein [Xanthomonas euvesicatoria]MDO7934519.1 hypothetical protein [Xanthomonas euvesicatoria pv. eucalypti]MDO7938663.1 hypothetical protein [Xanthomonas euvesicatoria pv. eucalypti]MDO7942899.1 hypothetical protein [Xanthomonas euvesicatoria pv. eucalypti]MDO7947111.1 hypothetical protein [Xanthomonas euvesicatoria pv. eucalypti]MDO7950144.1 hypothetical protein [Xanthomonas euvesicatoria pv. eucalypti]
MNRTEEYGSDGPGRHLMGARLHHIGQSAQETGALARPHRPRA